MTAAATGVPPSPPGCSSPSTASAPPAERALQPRDAVTPSQHRCLSIVVRRPIDTHGLVRTDAVDPIRRLPWPLR